MSSIMFNQPYRHPQQPENYLTRYHHHHYIAHLCNQMQPRYPCIEAAGEQAIEELYQRTGRTAGRLIITDAAGHSKLLDPGADAPLVRTIYTLYVLEPIPPQQLARIPEAKAQARYIAWQIAVRARHELTPMNGARYRFDRESVAVLDLGRARGDQAYGVGLSYAILEPAPTPDQNLWKP